MTYESRERKGKGIEKTLGERGGVRSPMVAVGPEVVESANCTSL